MDERRDEGAHAGRPPVRPGPETRTADALLAAVRPRYLDPDAEARAVAAFREAWRQRHGARPVRTRRRDDWRPRARRGAGRSLHTLLALLLSGATLGGVAVASMGNPPHAAAPQRPAPSDPPASQAPPQNTSGMHTAGDRSRTGTASEAPGKDAKKTAKAQDKADKAQDKNDKKAEKTANKAADKAAKATAKDSKHAANSANYAKATVKATEKSPQSKKK
ncbi:hypothetical protein ABT186_34400 [Streptomyces sp. NPDC001634]|uniref:hypothetical protein n=1 Tax=Streptomyces sp. NPDC001634 TaxID=3154390 RepID=UPI003324D622